MVLTVVYAQPVAGPAASSTSRALAGERSQIALMTVHSASLSRSFDICGRNYYRRSRASRRPPGGGGSGRQRGLRERGAALRRPGIDAPVVAEALEVVAQD